MSSEQTQSPSTVQKESKSASIIFQISKKKNKKIWTEEEDKALIYYSSMYQERHWEDVSKHFANKTALQCFSRFNRIRPGIIKGKWTQEEDNKIIELVALYGKNWSAIAKLFKTRNGKQIRDRYINVLDPSINKEKFTEEEDKLLTELYKENGPKWSEITKYFPNRTTDMIKNRFHSSIKKTFFCQENIKKPREHKHLFLKQKRTKNIEQVIENNNINTQTETDDDLSIDLMYSNCVNQDDFLSSICNSSNDTEHYYSNCTNCSSPDHICHETNESELFFNSFSN